MACSEEAKTAFYRSSNSYYGWRGGKLDVNEALQDKRKEKSEKEKQFLKEFWRTTNGEYGESDFNKSSLTGAVDGFHVARKCKTWKYDDPAVAETEKNYIEVTLGNNYRHNPKQENMIYTTSANDVGIKTPNPKTDGPGRIYPHSNKFTKTFRGMSRDCGLNTTIQKNRYMD